MKAKIFDILKPAFTENSFGAVFLTIIGIVVGRLFLQITMYGRVLGCIICHYLGGGMADNRKS
jgi:hypothetical protein